MVLVIVVMACWVNARSAILRLFFEIMMLRRLTKVPKRFSRGCWIMRKSDECRDGLKALKAEPDELRALSQFRLTVVPGEKLCETPKLYWLLWIGSPIAVVLTPVP